MSMFKVTLNDDQQIICNDNISTTAVPCDARISSIKVLSTGCTINLNNVLLSNFQNYIGVKALTDIEKVYSPHNKNDVAELEKAYSQGLNICSFICNAENNIISLLRNVNIQNDGLLLNETYPFISLHAEYCQYFIETSNMRLKKLIALYKHNGTRLLNRRADASGVMINEIINSKKTDTKYHTSISIIPSCLVGVMPFIDIVQFLYISPNMQHCGFIYDNNNYLYAANTKILNHDGDNPISVKLFKNESQQYYPRGFAKTVENSLYLPYHHICGSGKMVMINESDSESLLDEDEIEFNDTCGYYDSSTHVVIDNDLYDMDDCHCLHNGEWVLNDQAVWIEYESEFYHIDDCCQTYDNDWILENESVNVNGRIYHNQSDDVYSCEECGEYIHVDDMHSDGNGCYCDDCYSDNNSLFRLPYSSNVLDTKGFGRTSLNINNKPVFLGFELECKVLDNDDSINAINEYSKQVDYCIPTEDGSLNGKLGIEFIFRPEGLIEQKSNVLDFITYCKSDLNYKCKGYGLHVHVSDHWIGEATKLKIQNFVNLNHRFIMQIGGRDSDSYQNAKHSNFNTLSCRRYEFVNITSSNTIEFRFPQSIVSEKHINMNLELALALSMFCKFNLSILELKRNALGCWADFMDYVQINSDDYPILNTKLQSIRDVIVNELRDQTKQIKQTMQVA